VTSLVPKREKKKKKVKNGGMAGSFKISIHFTWDILTTSCGVIALKISTRTANGRFSILKSYPKTILRERKQGERKEGRKEAQREGHEVLIKAGHVTKTMRGGLWEVCGSLGWDWTLGMTIWRTGVKAGAQLELCKQTMMQLLQRFLRGWLWAPFWINKVVTESGFGEHGLLVLGLPSAPLSLLRKLNDPTVTSHAMLPQKLVQ